MDHTMQLSSIINQILKDHNEILFNNFLQCPSWSPFIPFHWTKLTSSAFFTHFQITLTDSLLFSLS